jgi:hypothetical protein
MFILKMLRRISVIGCRSFTKYYEGDQAKEGKMGGARTACEI